MKIQDLTSYGLRLDQAQNLMDKISKIDHIQDPLEKWAIISKTILTLDIPFECHEALYIETYKNFTGLWPAWIPDQKTISNSHIHNWMKELEFQTYEEFYSWSIHNKALFWEKACQKCGLHFDTAPHSILDDSAGVEQIQWLNGSQYNIAKSCLQGTRDQVAIKYSEHDSTIQSMSYGELEALTARVANGLRERNFKQGDRIALCLPMHKESIAIYLGIISAGCVAVCIADSFSPEEVNVRLEISSAKCIFTQDFIFRNGKALSLYEKVTELGHIPAIVIVKDESKWKSIKRNQDQSWLDFLSDNAQVVYESMNPDDECTILFSSGTTGHPKAIPWDHTVPIKSATDAMLHQDVHCGDTVCWPTNLGWMMGPWLVYASLMNKACMALSYEMPTSKAFCKFVMDAEVTMLGVIPSIVSAWRSNATIDDFQWTKIKTFSSTGECSNASDMHYLMSKAGYRPIIEYCGGTETGGGYVTGVVTKPCVPGTFSSKALGFSWILLNDENQETSEGEVFFEPPVLGLSQRLLEKDHHELYFQGVPLLDDGKIRRRHGDQLIDVGQQYYKALGRTDDAMNLGGIKVSSVQIEEVLQDLDAVLEVAAIAVAPEGGGPSRLVLAVVLKFEIDSSELKLQLQHLIKTKLNPLFKIHDIMLVDRLPRTASFKIMRKNLRQQYTSSLALT